MGTIAGLRAELKRATETLIQARTSTVSVSSGCELFLRFITMTSLEETVRWGGVGRREREGEKMRKGGGGGGEIKGEKREGEEKKKEGKSYTDVYFSGK